MFKGGYRYYDDVVIWNRAHLGEFVYSQMFREGDPKDLKEKLLTWEEFMLLSDEITIYLITLVADPDFLLNIEDGDSFSQTLEQKTKEVELFKEAHRFSLIENKMVLKVDHDGQFKPKETILDYIISFIK